MDQAKSLWSNERVRLWRGMFQAGLFPGAVTGGVIGLAPGVLLILVLTGGTYHVSASQVLGFIVMSIAAGALLGAAVGGGCAAVGGSVLRRLRRS